VTSRAELGQVVECGEGVVGELGEGLLEHQTTDAGLGASYIGQGTSRAEAQGSQVPGSGHYQGLRIACVEMGKCSPP
jgi:hypothetical protein